MPHLLWIDNDPGLTYPWVATLVGAGCTVDCVTTVTDAEQHLKMARYDLILLDVMIPVTAEEETSAYPPHLTDETHRTGLIFYQRHAASFRSVGTTVVVLTVRIDETIRHQFLAAGLPEERFRTKIELREAGQFLEFIQATLHNGG